MSNNREDNIMIEIKNFSKIYNGEYEAEAWGCDLTYDYVKINADYRS